MDFIIISVLQDYYSFIPPVQYLESQAINQRSPTGSICKLFRRLFDAHMIFCNTDTWQHRDLNPTTKKCTRWGKDERENEHGRCWLDHIMFGWKALKYSLVMKVE